MPQLPFVQPEKLVSSVATVLLPLDASLHARAFDFARRSATAHQLGKVCVEGGRGLFSFMCRAVAFFLLFFF